ncbi:MAG: Hsp70 family protein [Pseudonocardiaceae bacterium]
MGYSLGVDLGTTFVAAAIASATRVEMFTLGDRSVVTPATVYLREDGSLVTGEAASLRAVSSPDRVSREFKRRLGNPTPVMLGGQPHTVTALLGTLLGDVVQKVIETEGEPPDRIVLTHPANWGPFRRALFEEVPQHAGLENPSMVTEPEAAAAHYAASRLLVDGQTVAVYDLGGGTFDATVLRKLPTGVEILGTPEGVERLGGVDFDEAILSHVDYTADGALSELDMRDPQNIVALARLRQDCILAKEALSVDTETVLPVLLPGRHFDVRITRSDFEDMVRAPIESTIGALSRTLQSAQVQPTDLSAVLLVGGSSRIPLVARMVSAELGRPTVVDTHPKYAVALGAATLAAEAAPAPMRSADTVFGTRHQQRDDQKQDGQTPMSSNGLVMAIPAQRTPHREATAIPAHSPLEVGTTRPDTRPVRIPVPAAHPQLAQPSPPLSTPLSDNRAAGSGGGPTQPRTGIAPETTAPTWISPVIHSGRSLLAAVTGVGRRGWVLIAIVGLVLAGTIALVLAVVANQSSSDSTLPEPAPIAEPNGGPEVPIPSIGATIQVGKTPGFVAVSPNGRHAYIANRDIQVITVLDTAVDKVTATIPIPAGPPQFLAFAPNGRTLYVTIYNEQRTIHVIDVIDTTSNTVVATISQPARPFLPAVARDGKLLYVPNHDIASVSVVSTVDNTVVAQIKVPPNPHWVAFSRDGSRAYTANHESNVVSVIDTATRTVVATIPVGTSPHSIAVHPNRPLVANVNYDASSVSVIDTNTLKVVATIPVGKNPRDIVWAPDGRFAYVVNEGSNSVSVIDAGTNQVTATIPTGASPSSIAVLPSGMEAYVANLDTGTVTVLELAD